MKRILLTGAVLMGAVAAAATFGPRPASASGHAPWCAMTDVGWAGLQSDCSFWRFEDCLPAVQGGNRGFCAPNPEFRGAEPPRRRTYRRHHTRR